MVVSSPGPPNMPMPRLKSACAEDVLIGDGVGDRLADLRIVEGRDGYVHVDVEKFGIDRRADDLELAGRDQFGEVLRRQVEGEIGIALLEERAAGTDRGDLAADDPLEGGSGPDFQSSKRLKTISLARLPVFDHVGAAAGIVLADPFERPGILRGGVSPSRVPS